MEFDRLMGKTSSCNDEEIKQNLHNLGIQDVQAELAKITNFSDELSRPQNLKLMEIVVPLVRK